MSHRYHTMNVFGRSQGTRHQSPSSSMQECQWEDEGGGVRPGSPARHGGAGVSRYSLNLGGGAQTSLREKWAATTLLSLSPMTVAGPRLPGGPPALPGGTGPKEARSAARPRPPRCAPRPSPAPPPRALVLWLPFEVKVSDELECAVMLLLSSGVASKTPSLFQPPARLFLFWAFPSIPASCLFSASVLLCLSFLFSSPLAEWQTRAEQEGRPVHGEGPKKEGKLDSTANRHFFIHFWRFLTHFL